MSETNKPYIPASSVLPKTTVNPLILGALLSVILAAANAYLGLLAGMTLSACLPTVVVSMVVLKLFRNNNILENNVGLACLVGECFWLYKTSMGSYMKK